MRAFLLVPLFALGCSASSASDAPSPRGPLVLELFTSQGCSSCPPADRLLNGLVADARDGGLAPLAFHVDYWDDLGWPDPYASPAWTERQRQYARALGDNRVYTPELVVGGRQGLVGSNAAAVAKAIASVPRPPRLTTTASWTSKGLEVTATAPANADVVVAIWQDDQRTHVKRGENKGEILTASRVVRRLERVAKAGTRGTITVPLDVRWRAGGAVAFAQGTDKKIVASALLPAPPSGK